MYLSTTFTAAAFVALTQGATLTSRTTGDGTFYDGNLNGGTCSFVGYTIPSGVLGVAMSDSNWDGAEACGGCIEVTCPDGNKITAMVVDQCPGCGPGHLDLFPDAFAKLADPVKGVIPVSWNYVTCPINSPIQVRSKAGTSPSWFSMQVINASKRVAKLEFSTNGGSSWTGTERKEYNYFEYTPGCGSSTVDVRITSVDGDVVIVKGAGIGSDVETTATGNFGSGGSKPVDSPAPAPAPAEPVTPSTSAIIVKPVVTPSPQPAPQPTEPVATHAAPQEPSPAGEPAHPTTMGTSTVKHVVAGLATTSSAPAVTPSPSKSASVKNVTVTVTVTSCAEPTDAATRRVRSVLSEFKHLLRL